MDAFESVSSLFEEFEKDRSSSGTFITFNTTDDGDEDRSKIVFKMGGSESESSSDDNSDDDENESKSPVENEMDKSILLPKNLFDETEQDSEINSESNPKEIESKMPSNHFRVLHERNKFQRFANLIDSTRFVTDEESPGCQIVFQNNRLSRKYHHQIEQFIYTLLKQDEQDSERIPELDLKSSVPTCVDINTKLSSRYRTSDMWNAHAIIGCSQFHREFIVDPLGWPLINNNPNLTDGWFAPKYEQIFFDPLPYEDGDECARPQRPKATCFNCGGEHMIADCDRPKDFRQISINKKKFLETQGLQKQSSQRYHADDEVDPRFSCFKPGVISEALQKALGISSHKLPLYIYKMRILGYPPGWMEEAKVSTSGIAMFDKHGKEVNLDGDNMEEGEIDTAQTMPNGGEIDPEKIIEYAGFSSDTPKGTKDEHEKLGFPPLQQHQLKSTLKAQLEAMSELKKRKSNAEEEVKAKKQKTENTDMDISMEEDDLNVSVTGKRFRPPLPVNTPPSKPPLPDGTPPPTPEGLKLNVALAHQMSASNTSSQSSSPTLEELESQYKLLQKGLEETEDSGDVELQVLDSVEGSDEESSQETQELLDLKQTLNRCGSTSSIKTFGELGSGSPAGSVPGTPVINGSSAAVNFNLSSHKSVSISKDFGTPILNKADSVKSLPDSSKFSQGIEDHIPFENLADATGNFNKMRGLLSKIREKVSFRKKKS